MVLIFSLRLKIQIYLGIPEFKEGTSYIPEGLTKYKIEYNLMCLCLTIRTIVLPKFCTTVELITVKYLRVRITVTQRVVS